MSLKAQELIGSGRAVSQARIGKFSA